MTRDSPERQGRDLRALGPVQLDLSTCVNPYGPPDGVLTALRGMNPDAIRKHPYGAAEDVEAAYAGYTGQPVAGFTAGRGTSDLIWSLARHLDGKPPGCLCLLTPNSAGPSRRHAPSGAAHPPIRPPCG